MTDEDIEIAAGWTGELGEFTRTLCEVRFLDGAEDSRVVHDWAEHNPWAATRDKRVAAARTAAVERWRRSKHDTDGMRTACDSHETAMPTTQPNPTQPNLTQSKNQNPQSELKNSSDKEVLSRHPIGIKKEATSKLLLALSMAGYKAKTLCQDALEAYVHHHKCSFAEAADGLVDSWGKYKDSYDPFKKGIVKFLEEGIWKNAEVCSKKPAIVNAADEARRQLAEQRLTPTQKAFIQSGEAFARARAKHTAAIESDFYQLPADLDRVGGAEIWRSGLEKLAGLINKHSFDTWIRPVSSVGVCDKTLYLKIPTANFSNVGSKYSAELAEAVPGLTVRFVTPEMVPLW